MQSEKNIMSMKGITLIALVVTIVVLLILAGISISMLAGEEGIVKQAANAKEKNEIAQEKEYVSLATTEAYRLSEGSRLESMQNALNGYAGKDKTIVYEDDEFLVQFIESNRYYQVDENGDIYEYIKYEDTTPGELEEDTITKDGEEITVYKIESIEDLVAFSQNVNNGNTYTGKTILLARTLNFKSRFSYCNYETKEFDEYLGGDGSTGLMEQLSQNGKGFLAIGMDDESSFQGIFEGNNHSIKNIYIDASTKYVGLFGCVVNATVNDLYISGNIISTDTNVALCFGGLSGYSESSNITNCHISVDFNLYSQIFLYVGGINGYADNTKIYNVSNEGNILLRRIGGYLGGIVGFMVADDYSSSYIKLTHNTGNIRIEDSGANGFIGGIIGVRHYALVESCYNTGDLYLNSTSSGESKIGGIVSYSLYGVLNNCYNTGKLDIIAKGKSFVGGIAGQAKYGFYIYCYNMGNISGKSDVSTALGGIVGNYNDAGRVFGAYNTGSITLREESTTGDAHIGGVVALNWYVNDLSQLYNMGKIYIKGNVTTLNIGGAIGTSYTTAANNNWKDIYWLTGIADKGVGAGNSAETLAQKVDNIGLEDMTDQLNANKDKFTEALSIVDTTAILNDWKIVQGKNNGYPIIIY